MPTPNRIIICCLALTTLLSGCYESDVQHPSQVMATVDDKEITVHQLNELLTHSEIADNTAANITENTLNELIDLQLLANEAIKSKLNRSPDVVQALENAKLRLYADAYINKLVTEDRSDENTAISRLSSKHPDIFTNHLNYVVEETIVNQSLPLKSLELLFFRAKGYDEILKALEAPSIIVSKSMLSVPAENLNRGFSEKYQRPPEINDFSITQTASGLVIYGIINKIETPISTERRATLQTQMLKEQKTAEIRMHETARLRALANVKVLNNSIK